MKSKIEPLLSALIETNNGLTRYNLLNITREEEIYSTLHFVQVTSLHGHMRFSRKSSHLGSVTQARTRKSLK